MPEKLPKFTPVLVRWLKDVSGMPAFSGIEKIVKGETALLDPSEAGRAIASGLAEVDKDTPRYKPPAAPPPPAKKPKKGEE